MEGSRFSETIKPHWIVWAVLLVLILLTFYTRIINISIAPKFFEFDPYFDMIDTHYVLAYGHQLLLDPSAWPVVAAGTNHRIEPIVPYLEAYWYSLANQIKFHYSTFNTSLMSYVGSIYPPITAALLIFVVFVLLYHEYDYKIGLIGAGLAATMPTLISTFIAGEQLVEPWGIMTLFFFVMAYMLAVRNMKSKRLAILAGIAFVINIPRGALLHSNDRGTRALPGAAGIHRNSPGPRPQDFYKMNAIVAHRNRDIPCDIPALRIHSPEQDTKHTWHTVHHLRAAWRARNDIRARLPDQDGPAEGQVNAVNRSNSGA